MSTRIILIVLILALLVAGCTPTGQVVKQTDLEPIKIGVILPLSGSSAYIGEYIKNGLEMAKEEINSAGGVIDRRLELIYEDSQGDTKTGISAYQKLTQTDDAEIVLTAVSGVTLGVASLAEKDKIVILSIGGAAPSISEAGDYIFRHNLLPQEEARVLADFIYHKMNITRMGVLAVNTESGVSMSNDFKSDYEGLGGEIEITQMYARDEKDFKTYLLKIHEAGIKAVLNGGYSDQMSLIMKQSKAYGLSFTWFGVYSTETPEFLSAAGEAADGMIYIHFLNPEDSAFKAYDTKFNVIYGKSPDPYAALAYDALKIIAKALEECSAKDDSECIKQRLYATQDYHGVTGKISFDKNGDTHKELFIKTVKNGTFVKY